MPEGTLKGVDGEDTDINNTDILYMQVAYDELNY